MAKSTATELAQSLIRCPSITPQAAGAMDVVRASLEPWGFSCRDMIFTESRGSYAGEQVHNFYARRDGKPGKHLCFSGHLDVVPPGNEADWRHPPFAADIEDGILYGRGACDMKTAVACFMAAVGDFLDRYGETFTGTISLLLTTDEEGRAVNGTARALSKLADSGERFDGCLVGEPTNIHTLGDMVKVGRRGSLNTRLTVRGVQGHVAYPERAHNPIPELINFLNDLMVAVLDHGSEYFEPSRLQITSVDVGNQASNVIPAEAVAHINIRFNDQHSSASLQEWLKKRCAQSLKSYQLDILTSGESFLSSPGHLCDLLTQAIVSITGETPQRGTAGGTSDARFIQAYCPVVEFGLVGSSMHQVDEQVSLRDIDSLTAVYGCFLENFFDLKP